MGAAGGGSSGGSGSAGTYIVPQTRPTITAIQDVSPVSTGQTMIKEVAEAQGLESLEQYNLRVYGGKTQAEISASLTPKIQESGGTTFLSEDYSKQGGGVYTTPIAGFTGGWAGSGFMRMGMTSLESPKIQKMIAERKDIQAKVIKAYGGTEEDIARVEFMQGDPLFLNEAAVQESIAGIGGAYVPVQTMKYREVTSTPEQRAAEKQYYEKTGKVFTPETTVGDITSATGKTEQELIDIGLAQKTPTFKEPISQFMQEQGQFQFKKPSELESEKFSLEPPKPTGILPLDIYKQMEYEKERLSTTKYEDLSTIDKAVIAATSFETAISGLKTDIVGLESLHGDVLKSIYPETPAIGKYEKRMEEKYAKSLGEFKSVVEVKQSEYENLGLGEAGVKLAIESPVTLAVGFGAEFKAATIVGREGLVAAAAISAKSGIKYVPSALKFGAKAVEPVANIAGLGIVGYDVATSPDVETAAAKTILYGSLYPFAKFGWEKTGDIYSGIKLARVPTVESPIIAPEIVSGKSNIVLTKPGMKPEEFIKTFETKEGGLGGYHASAEALPKELPLVIKQGYAYSDVPGLYITPEQMGATAFPFQRGGKSSFKLPNLGDLFKSDPLDPTVQHITGIRSVERLPVEMRTKFPDTSLAKEHLGMSEFEVKKGIFGKEKWMWKEVPSKVEPGKAVLTPKLETHLKGKAEAEAVIVPGTTLKTVGKTGKFKFEGKWIKQKEMQVVESPVITKEPSFTKFESKKGIFKESDIYTRPGLRVAGLGGLYEKPAEDLISEKIIERYAPIKERFVPVEERYAPTEYRTTFSRATPERRPTERRPTERRPPVEERFIPPEYRPPTERRPEPTKYPRPYLDRYYSEEFRSEIPRDEVFINMQGEKEIRKKYKPKQGIRYTRKYRPSPIFGGAEKLFETTPESPLGTPRTSQVKRTTKKYRKVKPVVNFGLDSGKIKNPLKTSKTKIEKDKYKKGHKKKKKIKQMWEM